LFAVRAWRPRSSLLGAEACGRRPVPAGRENPPPEAGSEAARKEAGPKKLKPASDQPVATREKAVAHATPIGGRQSATAGVRGLLASFR
jgi:hypothetical protein